MPQYIAAVSGRTPARIASQISVCRSSVSLSGAPPGRESGSVVSWVWMSAVSRSVFIGELLVAGTDEVTAARVTLDCEAAAAGQLRGDDRRAAARERVVEQPARTQVVLDRPPE